MFKPLLLIFSLLILLTGCSPFGSDKDVRKSISGGLSPKTLYELAEDKINAGLINQAIDQYEIIIASYPSSKYALQSKLEIAYNLFKVKKYDRSIIHLKDFIERYPNIESTPYAYYLLGIIEEERSSSILDNIVTESAQRDVQSVRDAYFYYVMLLDKFPNSKYSEEAKEKLFELKDTLAKHELYVALYYTKNGSHIGAVNRSKYIIENFPNSNSVADALHLMAYNYDEINANKLAKDIRQILSSSYPNYSPSYSID